MSYLEWLPGKELFIELAANTINEKKKKFLSLFDRATFQ